jgi:cycloeucalenol cycloisomerase
MFAIETMYAVAINFTIMFTLLFSTWCLCTSTESKSHRWFADSKTNPSVRATEIWFLKYGIVWIISFGVVVAFEFYATWTAISLLIFMLSLAAPLYLQPFLFPSLTLERNIPILKRFSFQSNVWMAIFGFIGNYWYTHYFYSVLHAHYTMKSFDFNGVPIPMYFATHFYFCFYHVIANCIIRRISTGFIPSIQKKMFLILAVVCMSYTTAFMETVTIAGYKCYTFDNFHHVATVGSLFYAIYFMVSFPMFYYFSNKTSTLLECIVESLGTSMLVLCLLDFVRVWLGQDLVIRLIRPCKLNRSLSCYGDDVC